MDKELQRAVKELGVDVPVMAWRRVEGRLELYLYGGSVVYWPAPGSATAERSGPAPGSTTAERSEPAPGSATAERSTAQPTLADEAPGSTTAERSGPAPGSATAERSEPARSEPAPGSATAERAMGPVTADIAKVNHPAVRDLEGLKLRGLQVLAREHGINPTGMKKADLIKELRRRKA